jgi:predicted transcriptional regulator
MKKPNNIASDATIETALRELDRTGYDQMPVVDACGTVHGVVTTAHLLNVMLVRNHVSKADQVIKAVHTQFRRMKPSETLGKLARVLQVEPFVLVADDGK